jgi:hypothetical protein
MYGHTNAMTKIMMPTQKIDIKPIPKPIILHLLFRHNGYKAPLCELLTLSSFRDLKKSIFTESKRGYRNFGDIPA